MTSYTNLRKIFQQRLNPAAGGGVGGGSFQNADQKMNADSAQDSKNKVYVATVSRLTERYLSFRLRQNDLFGKHGETIFAILVACTKLSEKGATQLFAQVCMGEEPVVLRFANVWATNDWEHDKIAKKAYALKGKAVPPAQIQCLTVNGWTQLDLLVDIVEALPDPNQSFDFLRRALLAFYGKHNELLERLSGDISSQYQLTPLLRAELQEVGIPVT